MGINNLEVIIRLPKEEVLEEELEVEEEKPESLLSGISGMQVQCDEIRWQQFLRRCRLGQL